MSRKRIDYVDELSFFVDKIQMAENLFLREFCDCISDLIDFIPDTKEAEANKTTRKMDIISQMMLLLFSDIEEMAKSMSEEIHKS